MGAVRPKRAMRMPTARELNELMKAIWANLVEADGYITRAELLVSRLGILADDPAVEEEARKVADELYEATKRLAEIHSRRILPLFEKVLEALNKRLAQAQTR